MAWDWGYAVYSGHQYFGPPQMGKGGDFMQVAQAVVTNYREGGYLKYSGTSHNGPSHERTASL